MIESTWMWVRTLGSVCALGSMLCIACSDSEGNGATGGSGGGGAGGSGSGGTSNGGTSNGGTSNGGTSSGGTDAGTSECLACTSPLCVDTLAELCAALPEGCPERLETWLTCAARGEITPRAGVTEPRRLECDDHVVIVRGANGYGFRRWYYDADGDLVGVENVEDIGGARCGELVPNACRGGASTEPLVPPIAADAGSDASVSDGGASDSGPIDGGSAPECARL